jgi:tryptophanyl-tRNA synthetase
MTRVLTGITTSGTPHLGNYVGAVRPALAASRAPGVESFYFLADLHSLVKVQDAARVQRSTLEIAATWLAAGLEPDKVWFYRQSDIPEISELNWFLLFNADKVPVGRDQVQHIEMARDFGQRFNHLFGGEYFTLPEAAIEENVATLPGLDGRKMSKSYDNTIPLFGSAKQLKDAIARIVTDSRAPGEPKDPDSAHLFTLYQAFATPAQLAEFRAELLAGLAWGEAKQRLFQLLDNELGEARERYHALIERPADLEDILLAGAAKARKIATPFLNELREAVGLRSFRTNAQGSGEAKAKKAAKSARFVSFREDDGSFRFRLLDADGEQLLLSSAFADGKMAGQVSKRLQSGDELDLRVEGETFGLWLDDAQVATSPAFADAAARDAAIQRLYAALAPQE